MRCTFMRFTLPRSDLLLETGEQPLLSQLQRAALTAGRVGPSVLYSH